MSNETMLRSIKELISALSIDWSINDIESDQPETAYMIAGYLDATLNTAYTIAHRIQSEIQEDIAQTEAFWKEYKEGNNAE